MTIINMWVGRLAHGGARVRAKLSGVTSARLAVDTDPLFTAPTFFGPDTTTPEGMVTLDCDGLGPGGTYFYAIEEDSVLNTTTTGQFRTPGGLVGSPVSFTFAVSGDAGLSPDFPDTTGQVLAPDRISNAPVFDTIRNHILQPLFFIHVGDMTYYDLGSNNWGIVGGGSLDNYRRQWDDTLLQTRQHDLYRNIPLVYVWDDHDYGPNNSDGTLPTKINAATAYREKVPSYELSDPESIYHSFQIGRVLFIVLDTRYNRSPNSTPDGPSKTMLGDAQKVWLNNLLSTSTAEALVVTSSNPWMFIGGDAWPGFTTERAEVGQMFIDHGWTGRMIMLVGDFHKVAMDSGAGNPDGGFPVYQFGSLDASPGLNQQDYDIGDQGARDQYGTVSVTDDGATITLLSQGWRDESVIMSHQVVIQVAEPPPPPPPPPVGTPEVVQAKILDQLTWLSCDLVTGRIITELPNLVGDEVSRIIGRYTSNPIDLPIPAIGRDLSPEQKALIVDRAIRPDRTMIVAVVNDVPTFAGIPRADDQGTSATVPVGLLSLEGYLDYRHVRDHDFSDADEAVIVEGLLGDAEDIDGIGQGIGLTLDLPLTGRTRDRSYRASDHKTVYENLVELMNIDGGPEWTIDIDWTDDTHTAIAKVFRLRPRLGSANASPEVFSSEVFSSAGSSNAIYMRRRDFANGNHANYVIAYSSGQGEDQPTSDPAIDTDALEEGVPIWERHYQPSSSITDIGTLNGHAVAELARVRDGAVTWELTARWDAYPRYGVHWRLGDDVGYELKGHAHPNGVSGRARVIGFKLAINAGTVTPILQEEI